MLDPLFNIIMIIEVILTLSYSFTCRFSLKTVLVSLMGHTPSTVSGEMLTCASNVERIVVTSS